MFPALGRRVRGWGGVGAVIFLLVCPLGAAVERRFVGEEIPSRFTVGGSGIFTGSDSLFLNGRLLERGKDYVYRKAERMFDLSSLSAGSADTLTIRYEPLPRWLLRSYGRTVPPISSSPSSNGFSASSHLPSPWKKGTSQSSQVTLSGTKAFSFTTQTAGTSRFSQSLALELRGSLSPGVEIAGTISDKGYTPAYGPLNSRLSDLDRVNLRLRSERVKAQVGDILIPGALRTEFDMPTAKRLSGASVELRGDRWHTDGLVARPKGKFQTSRFVGIDGVQGPYQIGEEKTFTAIVPGSERVWLDGKLLERGADKDYTIDYPTGRITFSALHPIDRLSRIEIDYEPRLSDYRGELYAASGGVVNGDSAFFMSVGFYREGDDKLQPLRGELTEEEKRLLDEVGDSVGAAFRSGVVTDSGGNYTLVVDSLPDSVLQYVGGGNGEYRVTFSYVGEGKGEYRFLGGEIYQYVGEGEGDYLPIVGIPVPERIDFYVTRLGLREPHLGEVRFDVRQSSYDKNLFSSRDDGDNVGGMYTLSWRKEWYQDRRKNFWRFMVRRKDSNFKTRARVYDVDFGRQVFYPPNYQVHTREVLSTLDMTVQPFSYLLLSPSLVAVRHQGAFESVSGRIRTDLPMHRSLSASWSWQHIAARAYLPDKTTGEADVIAGKVQYRLPRGITFSSRYEFDRRVNTYTHELHGTRYHLYRGGVRSLTEQVEYELYVEDSLIGQWHNSLNRNRLSLRSRRSFGRVTGEAQFTFQWLRRDEETRKSFLGRTHFRYSDIARRLDLNTSYSLSKETRHARGITYIEVEPGQGDYTLENGEYLPDEHGEYLRVEEILSEAAEVSKAEKSFFASKDFHLVSLRFTSQIREELLPSGKRQWWWVVPFLSSDGQPYLFYVRRQRLDMKAIPSRGIYLLNLIASQEVEKRFLSGTERKKGASAVEFTVKQATGHLYFSESVRLFSTERDAYYNGIGKVDGYRLRASVKRLLSSYEITSGVAYRMAKAQNDDRVKSYSLFLNTRRQFLKRGNIRTTFEWYRQDIDAAEPVSYQLTDNKSGNQGVLWSLRVQYGVKEGVRCRLDVSGRHADNRRARLTGKGELVVGF